MTREKAIERYEGIRYTVACFTGSKKDCDAVDMAFSALRPVSREQVEQMRGRWITVVEVNGKQYSKCAACQEGLDGLEDTYNFCPRCGAPMTDEAVDILLKRLEALKDG